jgi:hypothetical protein
MNSKEIKSNLKHFNKLFEEELDKISDKSTKNDLNKIKSEINSQQERLFRMNHHIDHLLKNNLHN